MEGFAAVYYKVKIILQNCAQNVACQAILKRQGH